MDARGCFELWNALARRSSTSGQSPADYVADLRKAGPVHVLVTTYGRDNCLVIAAFHDSQGAWGFVAVDGRGPYNLPARVDLREKFGGRAKVPFNAAGKRDGSLAPRAP
jgi:hypothetical protein